MAQTVKILPANAGERGSIPVLGRSPGEEKWQPTPVFLPGESRGQRSLAGYSPWGRKELNTTERLNTYTQGQLGCYPLVFRRELGLAPALWILTACCKPEGRHRGSHSKDRTVHILEGGCPEPGWNTLGGPGRLPCLSPALLSQRARAGQAPEQLRGPRRPPSLPAPALLSHFTSTWLRRQMLGPIPSLMNL